MLPNQPEGMLLDRLLRRAHNGDWALPAEISIEQAEKIAFVSPPGTGSPNRCPGNLDPGPGTGDEGDLAVEQATASA